VVTLSALFNHLLHRTSLAIPLFVFSDLNNTTQKMNASGYREKAPQRKQDEDTRKLAALLGELEIIDEVESKLDANN